MVVDVPPVSPEEIRNNIISGLTDEPIVQTEPPVVVPQVVEPPVVVPPAVPSAGEPPVTPVAPVVVPPVVPTFNPMWNQMAERLSTADTPWEIPAHIKDGKLPEGQTELDVLLDIIYANTDYSSVPGFNDPVVQEYIAASQQPNFSREAWFASKTGQQNMAQLKGKEFLKAHYNAYKLKSETNPNGYTAEQIETYLNTKSDIELDQEAEITKRMWTDSEQQKLTAHQAAEKVKADKLFNDQEATNLQAINTFIESSKPVKDFYGIEFSEAEKAQFFKDLPGMFKRDPVTQLSKMDELMQSEGEILNIAALLWKGAVGVRAQQSAIKEGVKTALEEKLGLQRQVIDGSVVTPRGPYDPSQLV